MDQQQREQRAQEKAAEKAAAQAARRALLKPRVDAARASLADGYAALRAEKAAALEARRTRRGR